MKMVRLFEVFALLEKLHTTSGAIHTSLEKDYLLMVAFGALPTTC